MTVTIVTVSVRYDRNASFVARSRSPGHVPAPAPLAPDHLRACARSRPVNGLKQLLRWVMEFRNFRTTAPALAGA